ncbi:MAG: hypothetical protein AB1782_08620 [Cyanobacteriota bacterium]
MYKLEFKPIYTDKKLCLCGCSDSIQEENWGLKVIINGKLTSFEECKEIIEKFEDAVRDLSGKTLTCKYCGNCCNNGPEISKMELDYLFKTFPEHKNDYINITSGHDCPAGGSQKGPCIFSINARPLQCRLLYCEANIVGFEYLYNFLAEFIGWSKVDYSNLDFA